MTGPRASAAKCTPALAGINCFETTACVVLAFAVLSTEARLIAVLSSN